jgi:alkanesulfonate monooxygenase SsuD/methylene tetrahydromethanopterin reductase-like flavin-dependent oxidoreductase (luciferase family)
MQFGLFGSAAARRGGPEFDSSEGFRDFIEYNIEAETLGFHSTFVVEHHFTGYGQVSATLNLLTWLGACTRRLRLGTAVIVLPWHNPVLLAEQAATLDLLSGGRLDFGVGKGYRYNEFAGFCVPMEEADTRFDEAIDVIVKAWTCRRAILAPRQVLAVRRHRRRAADCAEAPPADLDGGRRGALGSARRATGL